MTVLLRLLTDQTLKKVFDHISKQLGVRKKYSSARRTLNSFFGVKKSGQI